MAGARNIERNQLLLQVQQAKSQLERQKQSLTASHQRVLEQSATLATLREEFRNLDSSYTSLASVAAKDETIDHYPTPIAKTVFSDEVHFRLRSGRLVHVPMNDLVDQMKRKPGNWKRLMKRLKPLGQSRTFACNTICEPTSAKFKLPLALPSSDSLSSLASYLSPSATTSEIPWKLLYRATPFSKGGSNFRLRNRRPFLFGCIRTVSKSLIS